MVINIALHPRILEQLIKFKAQIYNPQAASSSPLKVEHQKAAGDYGRVWVKQKGPKLFFWLVGAPIVYGSFLIWAAASDTLVSKVALGIATAGSIAGIVWSVVRDRSSMSLDELECFLPAFNCTSSERLYCEIFALLHRSKSIDGPQQAEIGKLLNQLLDLEYVLADQDNELSLVSVESIEQQFAKLNCQGELAQDHALERFQHDLADRLLQAKAELPVRERIATARALIESSLIGLRHDLLRSQRLSAVNLDPLAQTKELLAQVYGQTKAIEDARKELESFVAGTVSTEQGKTEENPSAAQQQKGLSS